MTLKDKLELPEMFMGGQVVTVALLVLAARTGGLKTSASEDYYRGAVVEYHPLVGESGNQTLQLNAQQYVNIIQEAAKHADIVVFPEAGLQKGDSTVSLRIPFERNATSSAADDTSLHPDLRLLADAARNNSMYVVINVHEEEKSDNLTLKYNSNVVFDRNGTIIARYRKYNLFSEKRFLNITKYPERVYFDTDFGVRFGTFICFDILFEDPTLELNQFNVTDYVFPTWWFSEQPFLTAVQEQAGWSYATDSTLLAANGNQVNVASSGSGIFNGRKGPLVYIQTNYNQSVLLTAKIYKKGTNGTSVGEMIRLSNPAAIPQSDKGIQNMKRDISLDGYVTAPINPLNDSLIPDQQNSSFKENTTFKGRICSNDLCCEYLLNVCYTYRRLPSAGPGTVWLGKADGFSSYYYKVGVFEGVRSFDGFATGGIQTCGVFSCLNESLASCGRTTWKVEPHTVTHPVYGDLYLDTTRFESGQLKLVGLDKDGSAVPSVLEESLEPEMFGSPLDPERFHFSRSPGSKSGELNFTSEHLGTAAIYSRVFSWDGQPPGNYRRPAEDRQQGTTDGGVTRYAHLGLIPTSLCLALYLSEFGTI